jgi:Fe2+ transport system protein B
VGFVAKEILLGGLAVIYGVPEAGLGAALLHHLDWASAMSFLIFTLIYVPCLSTVAAIRRESKAARLLRCRWHGRCYWPGSLLLSSTRGALLR